jgi:hypothetical protein
MTIRYFLLTAAVALALAAPAAIDGAHAQQQMQGSTTVPSGALTEGRLGANQFFAKKLIGMNVYEPGNREIGDIEDLVIERDGRISAAIVSIGGALGLGERHVALPLSQLSIDGNRAVTNMTREQLAQAPRFTYQRGQDHRSVGSGTTVPPTPAPAQPMPR